MKAGSRQEEKRTEPFDVDEVDVVGRRVDYGPEGHRIGNLPVEPGGLIDRGEPAQCLAEDAKGVTQHRDEDQASVEGEDKTGTTRDPD